MPYNLLLEDSLPVYIYELEHFLQWGDARRPGGIRRLVELFRGVPIGGRPRQRVGR